MEINSVVLITDEHLRANSNRRYSGAYTPEADSFTSFTSVCIHGAEGDVNINNPRLRERSSLCTTRVDWGDKWHGSRVIIFTSLFYCLEVLGLREWSLESLLIDGGYTGNFISFLDFEFTFYSRIFITTRKHQSFVRILNQEPMIAMGYLS